MRKRNRQCGKAWRGDIKLAATVRIDQEIDRETRKSIRNASSCCCGSSQLLLDLRLISSVLKMITDIERIGDQASDIGDCNVSVGACGHNTHIDRWRRQPLNGDQLGCVCPP